jgi:regulatory protein
MHTKRKIKPGVPKICYNGGMKAEQFKIRKNGADIVIEGQKHFLALDTLVRFGINAESSFSPDELGEILIYNERISAKEYLLGLLARYRKSEAEAKRKLKEKGYSSFAITEAMNLARQYRYLDDAQYAIDFVKINQTRKGAHKIRRELMLKGIKKEHIEEALQELSREEQLLSAQKLCEKMSKGEQKGYKLKQKIYARLMRAGYASDIVAETLKNYELYEYGDVPEYE